MWSCSHASSYPASRIASCCASCTCSSISSPQVANAHVHRPRRANASRRSGRTCCYLARINRLVLAHEFGPAVVAHGRAVFVPVRLPATATFGIVALFGLKATLRAHEAALVVVESLLSRTKARMPSSSAAAGEPIIPPAAEDRAQVPLERPGLDSP